MKNKFLFLAITLLLFTVTSCQKKRTVITIEVNTNDIFTYFKLHYSCEPGLNQLPSGPSSYLDYLGNGNYHHETYEVPKVKCFTITGTIPENNDSIGKTIVNIDAFYTEEGNIVGFKNIELKRPHGEYKISYKFRADTYIE